MYYARFATCIEGLVTFLDQSIAIHSKMRRLDKSSGGLLIIANQVG